MSNVVRDPSTPNPAWQRWLWLRAWHDQPVLWVCCHISQRALIQPRCANPECNRLMVMAKESESA